MAEASGDWLTFVDADDRLEPAHLEALVAGVRDDVDMVVGGFTQIKVKDNIRTMCRIKEDMAFGREYLKRDNLIIGICCNKLFRMCKIREWGGAFDERQTYAEDAVYSLSFLLQTQKMNTVAMTGYQYLCRDENSANDKYQACIVDAYQRMTDLVATLMEKAKCSEKEIVIYRLGQAYYTSYFGVCNLFKKGCPLSFREKVREIERFVFREPATMEAIKAYRFRSTHNIQLKTYDFSLLFHSPWVVALSTKLQYAVKYHLTGLYRLLKK